MNSFQYDRQSQQENKLLEATTPEFSDFRILQLADVLPIPVTDNGERILSLNDNCSEIICEHQKAEIIEKYGNRMFLREGVIEKLKAVQKAIDASANFDPGTKLLVAYAYRYLSDQKMFFEQAVDRMREAYPNASDEELRSLANQEAAAPEVAGHPTGGAVDVTLRFPDGTLLDTGSGISDFSDPEEYPVLSKKISSEQQANRFLLRELMLEQGFAPFNGEWWHFSYGDKEWAAFYNKPEAIYSQVELEED